MSEKSFHTPPDGVEVNLRRVCSVGGSISREQAQRAICCPGRASLL